MLLSSLVAGILAIIFQGASVTDVATAMNTGYEAQTGVVKVDELISRGGLMSMMETQLIAFTAFSFGGIMQRTGMLSVILDRVMRFASKTWRCPNDHRFLNCHSYDDSELLPVDDHSWRASLTDLQEKRPCS